MHKPESHLIVIFGASGDLTFRKLIPALYRLWERKFMPDDYTILGIGRTAMSTRKFREKMNEAVLKFTAVKATSDQFLKNLNYLSMDYSDPSGYQDLVEKLGIIKEDMKYRPDILFYLATPPSLYETISENLAHARLNAAGAKIIIEKPFGYDLESAKKLNHNLLKHFHEEQIYRIDHYLGKETVQNILVTRFSNTIFEPVWNRNYIHRVEITSSETLGVEDRGGYYDSSGALRDMVQNHLLQLVGIIAMEPPVNADAVSIRNETVKVFQSLRPLTEEEIRTHVIRGQYLESIVKGEKLPAYRNEKEVKPGSKTETYAAMKFFIDNWRWKGVPFYIRTGKRLPSRVTEVVIHFRETPHHIFSHHNGLVHNYNQLIIRIQPNEGILLKFGMKVPGAGFAVQTVNMDFHYSSLADVKLPEAYERLLLDCMLNDPTLYARADAVEITWQFINPVLKVWKNDDSIPLYGYPSGTWGPDVADNLI
ncbi:MAG: glucose-6-phosphate dehydrogenase, partial [Bacteroidales bacterium]|nr:glucose-6-phosphate dehydrogenase [Bacteroidales bacterium]